MKIVLLSDLHVDVRPFISPFKLHKDHDTIVILPGDVCPINDYAFKHTIKSICEEVNYLLFVPGNHEYYHCDIVKDQHILVELQKEIENFVFLDNDRITINNINFIGATLWTDMNHNNPIDMHACKNGMNDFWIIKNNGKSFNPEDTVILHEKSVEFIKQELLSSQYGGNINPNIVITHHAPSYESVIAKYKGDAINAAFASELSEMILRNNIAYWVHGHMHAKIDYMIGKTRVICNPRGYNNKENPNFNPEMELIL